MEAKGKTLVGAAALLALLGLAQAAPTATSTGPVFTNTSADFWGQAAGSLRLRVGETITAYDPQGVLCGRYVVKQRGLYGFMHVYGDDTMTPQDEGARSGDIIAFRVNGRKVKCAGPDQPVWTGDGECIHVNLSR